jgi:hypothetical protein
VLRKKQDELFLPSLKKLLAHGLLGVLGFSQP